MMTTEAEVAQIIENLRQTVAASEAKDKYIKQLELQADRHAAQIKAKDAALEQAREVVSSIVGDSRPARLWAREVRQAIDAAISLTAKGGRAND